MKLLSVPCAAILRIPSASSSNGRSLSTAHTGSTQQSLPFDDEPVSRLESVWELDVASDRSVFEEEEDTTWSEESVLE